jgi:hypothetical protein
MVQKENIFLTKKAAVNIELAIVKKDTENIAKWQK